MRNSKSLTCLAFSVVLATLPASLVACADDASSGAAPPAAGGNGTPDATDGGVDAAPQPGTVVPIVAAPIQVSGQVVDSWNRAVVTANVIVLDARGERSVAELDLGGRFVIADVVTPYDLVVAPQESDITSSPVYAGLTRSEVTVRYAGSEIAPPVQLRGTVSVKVVLPMALWGSESNVEVVTTSANGGSGSVSLHQGSPTTQVQLDVVHTWLTPTEGPTWLGTVAIDVLISDEAKRSFWYVRGQIDTTAGPLFPDGKANGVMIPSLVGTVGPVNVSTTDPAGAAAAMPLPLLTSYFRFPGASVPLQLETATGQTMAAYFPSVPGGAYDFDARSDATTVDASGRPSASLTRMATSAESPLTSPGPVLAIPGPLAAIAPRENGALALGTAPSFAWRPVAGHVTSLTVFDAATSHVQGRIVSGGASLSLDRLARLGIVYRPGQYRLMLQATPGASTDELLAPAPATATPPSPAVGTDWSVSQFSFTVAR